ncbi:MAG: TraB/GumN family protein [Novosphingobium sp.]
MKRILRHLALATAAFATCLGASPPQPGQRLPSPQLETLVPAGASARPALWKVADEDTTIWLFGTVHALPGGIEWFDGKVAESFDGSQELVTEILETSGESMQKSVLSRAMLPAGKTLRGLMNKEDREEFEAALAGEGLPAATLDRFKPWYAAIFLSTLPILKQGFDPNNGVEKALDARAKALSQSHSALETAEFQLSLFDSLPQDVQMRYLKEVARTMPQAGDELTGMIEAWQKGDAETLARLMNADEEEPALMEKLLYARNKTWADWIRTRLDQPGTVFLAVGAGHLAGSGSVQQELRARGIASQRIQ